MNRHIWIISLFLLIIISSSVSPKSSEPETTVIYYFNRMPFYGTPGSEKEGIIISITRMIFDEAKLPYRFQIIPVTRMFEIMKEPGHSCVAGVFKNPDRELLYKYSDEFIFQDSPPPFVIQKNNLINFSKVRTISDLLTNGMTLGVVEKYSYGAWVDSNIKRYNPRHVELNIGDNQSNFFRMLLVRRFDYLFSGLEEARYNLSTAKEYNENLIIMGLQDAPAGNKRYMFFNKNYPEEELKILNKAVISVKKKPEYQAILKKARQ